jgi:Spy/CpxP family protein refolding chaperone
MRCGRVLAGGALLATLLLLSSDGLMSQDKKEGKLKGQLPPGWGKLELTAAQKEEIYKLNSEYKHKVDKLQEEIRTLQAELARKRVAVLTDEQKKKLVDIVSGEPAKEKAKDTAKEKAKTNPGK